MPGEDLLRRMEDLAVRLSELWDEEEAAIEKIQAKIKAQLRREFADLSDTDFERIYYPAIRLHSDARLEWVDDEFRKLRGGEDVE